jgi:hypothetical protein
MAVAEQRISPDEEHPSAVVLPIIPKGGGTFLTTLSPHDFL